MAEILPSGLQQTQRTQARYAAQGILDESFPVTGTVTQVAPATQTVYGVLVGLAAADVVTGVLLRNSTAAAGTSPTTARAGLADATGKILVLSGNLNAAASWPAGPMPLAFTAPFTITATGGYYLCYVVDGVWGTTQPTPAEGTGVGSLSGAFGAFAPPGFIWSGRTDLPAIGASLTLVGTGRNYYMAAF